MKKLTYLCFVSSIILSVSNGNGDTAFPAIQTRRIYAPVDNASLTRIEDPDRDDIYRTTLYGFKDAATNTVPVKKKTEDGQYLLEWKTYSLPDSSPGINGCFALVNGFMVNTYYNVGGRTYAAGTGQTLTPGCITALKISASGSPSATYEIYSGLSDLQSAQNDTAYYIIPLYTTDSSGNVTCDWRTAPSASMGENL